MPQETLASCVSFSKGDIGVEIDMPMLPGERETAIRLARLIAGRLRSAPLSRAGAPPHATRTGAR